MEDVLKALSVAFTEFAPRLLGALLVFALMLLAARLLQRLARKFLREIGLDALFERTGTVASLVRIGLSAAPSDIFGYVIFWGILLAGAASALSILGLSTLQENMNLLVVLAGKALVAVLILIAGLAAAGWLSYLTVREADRAGISGGGLFGRAVFAATIAVAVLLAAAQVGVNVSLLVLLTIIFLGTVGLMIAIALGLGLAPLSGNIAAGRYVQGNIQLGDEISVNGTRGTVEQIGFASVTLKSEDGNLHYVPHRAMLDAIVSKAARRD